jgi:ABC-type microcin C transport system permease subunit YejB
VNLLDFTARASKLVNPPTLAAVPLSRSLSNSSIFTNTVGNEPGIVTVPIPTTSGTSNDQYDYYRVVVVVIAGEISRIILSHLLIVIMASSLWNVSIREVIIDDWKMLNLGVKMLEELGEYILGDAKKL